MNSPVEISRAASPRRSRRERSRRGVRTVIGSTLLVTTASGGWPPPVASRSAFRIRRRGPSPPCHLTERSSRSRSEEKTERGTYGSSRFRRRGSRPGSLRAIGGLRRAGLHPGRYPRPHAHRGRCTGRAGRRRRRIGCADAVAPSLWPGHGPRRGPVRVRPRQPEGRGCVVVRCGAAGGGRPSVQRRLPARDHGPGGRRL